MAQDTDLSRDQVMPGEKKIVSADLFMTENDLALFAGYTALLERTEHDETIKSAKSKGETLDLKLEQRHGKYYDIYEDLQKTHTNAITRENEVVAVSISGKPQKNSDGTMNVVDNVQIVVVENPRRDDHVPLQNAAAATKMHVVAKFDPTSELQAYSATIDTVRFVLKKYSEALSQNLTNIPFAHHVGNYADLLQRCHKSTDTHEARNAAKSQMHVYVFMVSNAKMARRAQMGTRSKNRNFLEMLRRTPAQFPAALWTLDDVPQEQVCTALPTSAESECLVQYFSNISNYPQEQLARIPHESVYGKNGRKRFHMLLSSHVNAAYNALVELDAATHFYDRNAKSRKIKKIPTDEQDIQRIADLVDAAISCVRRLTMLTHQFKNVLRIHLQWLGARLGIKSRSDEIPTQIVPPPDPESDDDDDDENDEAQADDEIEMRQMLKSFNLNLDDFAKLTPDNQMAAMTPAAKGWADTALKWIGLMCLHDSSLAEITAFDHEHITTDQIRRSERIQRAKIAIIDIQQRDFNMGSRASPRACVEDLRKMDGRLKLEFFTKVFANDYNARTKQNDTKGFFESTYLKGTMHCEAILLALAACVSDERIAKNMTQAWLDRNGVFAIRADLLEIFGTMLPLVADSKRCCPSCWRLCESIAKSKVIQSDEDKLTVPGHHMKWSAAALPPFMPKDIGDKLLHRVRGEALARLRKIQGLDTPADEHQGSSSQDSRVGDVKSDAIMNSDAPSIPLQENRFQIEDFSLPEPVESSPPNFTGGPDSDPAGDEDHQHMSKKQRRV